jgi:DnaK suppressor protein
MIVSILQLMGFGFGKSIQSRPETGTGTGAVRQPSKVDNKGITRVKDDHTSPDTERSAHARTVADSARRQDVKAPSGKSQTPAKAPKTAAAATRAVANGAAVAKAAAKPASKTVKAAAKTTSAPAVAKPVAAKTVKPAAKAPVAPAAKPAETASPTSSSRKTAASAPAAPAKAVRPAAKPSSPAPVPVASPAPGTPVRATRPSSRLIQLTVPSMAPAVASTAAKASYTQTMPTPVLTPPPFAPIKKDPKLANNWKAKTVDQLTDAEILAMPDSEYMNDTQMAFFRLKLSQLKQDILNNAGETTEHLREDTVIVPDPADRATIEEEHALELRTRDRERKLLKKIEQSIARIDAGDYGYCDETGEPIGVGRLLARPTATLSLEAQQRRELKQKMFGD